MKYGQKHTRTMWELRKRMFERGFQVFNLKRRYQKHPTEFLAVKTNGTLFEPALVRFWRGRVRIQFLEMKNAWDGATARHVLSVNKLPECVPVFASPQMRNKPHIRFKPRYWHEFVLKTELKKDGFARANQELQNAGIKVENISSS